MMSQCNDTSLLFAVVCTLVVVNIVVIFLPKIISVVVFDSVTSCWRSTTVCLHKSGLHMTRGGTKAAASAHNARWAEDLFESLPRTAEGVDLMMSKKSPTGYQGVWRDKCSTSRRRFIAEVNLSSAEQKRLVVSHSLLSLGTFDTAVKGAVSHARFRLVCATPSPPQPIDYN